MKILNITHGHPDIIRGGAEVASYHLHEEYRRRSGIRSVYLAGMNKPGLEARSFTPFSAYDTTRDELLFVQPPAAFNAFLLTPRSPNELLTHFADFLASSRPDVVHFHHFMGIGTAAIRVARNTLPETPFVLTLYEYLPICPHNGQFVKTGTMELCYRASPRACHGCFPEVSPQDFFLRDAYFKSHYRLIDRFVASSRFIKQRYVEWGIEEARITLIDNGFPRAKPVPSRTRVAGEGRGRFAYFGQLNPYKGVLTLLEAFSLIPASAPAWLSLEVFGANLDRQSDSFRRDVQRLLEANPRVRLRGEYRNVDMPLLLSDIDWVVVPSLWWENSPLVIQEANTFGRPVIASNIGGMAEKVRHRVDGLTFDVGSPTALRDILMEAATSEGLWERLARELVGGPWIDEIADSLIGEYSALLAQRAGGRQAASRRAR